MEGYSITPTIEQTDSGYEARIAIVYRGEKINIVIPAVDRDQAKISLVSGCHHYLCQVMEDFMTVVAYSRGGSVQTFGGDELWCYMVEAYGTPYTYYELPQRIKDCFGQLLEKIPSENDHYGRPKSAYTTRLRNILQFISHMATMNVKMLNRLNSQKADLAA
jgi:hypothetical protein